MNKSLKVIALIAAVVSMVPLEAKKRRRGCRNGMCGVRVAQVNSVTPTVVAPVVLVGVAPEAVVKRATVNKAALIGTIGGKVSLVTDSATDKTDDKEEAAEVVTTLSV